MDMTSVFAPITKSFEQEDGTLLVYGKATGSDLDLDQQRCSPEWLKRAMPDWFAVGNIREQHDKFRAAGKAVEHEVKDDGHWIKANIVDPIAVAKTKAGVYTGFSIGISQPRVEKNAAAPNGMISDGRIVEVSLVDRPCLPTATLTVCKSAKPGMQVNAGDFDSDRLLVRCEELIEKSDAAPEMTVTLGEAIPADQAAKLAEKATDTAHLDEPAPGQVCADCNGEGHLNCGPLDGKAEGLQVGNTYSAEAIAEHSPSAAFTELKSADFDVDAAKALVAATLAKASDDMPPSYAPEQDDIQNAQAAIGIISRLIISEASEMCDNPAEDCDIELLMNAVQALRCFQHREQEQAMGADVVKKPVPVLQLSDEPDLEKAKYSADELRQMLSAGKAIKNANGEPSYPIGDKKDLENAIHAVGRGSGDHDDIRAYITRRAKALGASDMIPENWSSKVDDVVDAQKAADETLEKSDNVTDTVTETDTDVVKTSDPDTTKADVEETTDADALVKALSAALEKADSPLRRTFMDIAEAATESTAKSVSELAGRLEKVEQMATPGGPALRRSEIERSQARRTDLGAEVMRLKALASNSDDRVLRQGYTTKALALEAELKSL